MKGQTGEVMAKTKKRNRKNSKESQAKREWDLDDYAHMAMNVALCSGGLSVPCFIFGCSGLGFILIGICGIIMFLIFAAFVVWSVFVAKILNHIPHR